MEELRIEKNKTYTYDEIKKIFENAKLRTTAEPTGDFEKGKDDAQFQFIMMMNSVVILNTMGKNMFEKEDK